MPERMFHRQHAACARQEGAVMLVVMLILLVATALASVALQTTQYELRASAYNRVATQMQYVAETELTATLTYVDGLAAQSSLPAFFLGTPAAPVTDPSMVFYGEPAIFPATQRNWQVRRTQWTNQALFFLLFNLPPVSNAAPGVPDSSGKISDALGTLGPVTNYLVGDVASAYNNGAMPTPGSPGDFATDLYDCQCRRGGGRAGSQVNEGNMDSMKTGNYFCVATVHGRAFLPAPTAAHIAATKKDWGLTSGTYTTSRFAAAHDARAMIMTGDTTCP